MVDSRRPQDLEVEELLRNAELRNALEPFYDESISRVNVQHLPLAVENEFLASMLAWEQAPVLPIYRWFEPELRPRWRTNGVAIPGYQSGWFKLRNGERALLFVRDKRRVVYVPTSEGYSLLVSVDEPERVAAQLRQSGGGSGEDS